jgi:predicted DNA-binding transcriptional regulator AlpA
MKDNTHNNEDRLLTTRQLAEFLQLRPQSIRKARVTGHCSPPYFKLGANGPVRYRLSDVLAWLEQNRFRSTSENTSEARKDKIS